jgi:hypothetical protein
MKIRTFSNASSSGSSVFKALSHPLAAPKARALIERLKGKRLAVYDPFGQAGDMAELYDMSGLTVGSLYVQNVADMGRALFGRTAEPVTALAASTADTLLVASFDARVMDHIRPLIPASATVITFDELRIPDAMLTNKRNYLDNLNFATNFAFFREADGHHTRLVTANYWAGYGAKNSWLWLNLFDDQGNTLAQWRQDLSEGTHLIALDSAEIRKAHNLPPFTGTLFFHAINIAGHDTVKYALDTYGDSPTVLSCTHDSNAWPADFYAGLPAPKPGERVTLWVENCYPCPIPSGTIGLNLMGDDTVATLQQPIPPYGQLAIDVASLLPGAKWPQQIEIQAQRSFARPRYEVLSPQGRLRIAHANVERTDLKPDPGIPGLTALMGKGYILPAPILPLDRYNSIALPTPMAREQADLPLAMIIYDADGTEICRHPIGKLLRKDSVAFDVADILKQHNKTLPSGTGHLELIYDFSQGGGADGWLHGLFRYEDRQSGHAAETSFGAHIFNTALVYKNEPQSYTGKPPGLSTRLFLRLGAGQPGSASNPDAFCHLVYPASTPWHATSETDLLLFDKSGTEIAKKRIAIPCSGSLLWRTSEQFDEEIRLKAGENAYILIRDTTCRLFGYHGLRNGDEAFSLDHMFGF